jgi:acyl-CoA thioester hydrolase
MFPFWHTRTVEWRDLDAMNHVNNARYFSYLESARLAHMQAMGLLSLTPDHSIAPVLADTWCSYRRPALLNDTLEVGVRVEAIDAERGEYANRYAIVRSSEAGEPTVLVQAGATIVVCDTRSGARTQLPPPFLDALRRQEQEAATE